MNYYSPYFGFAPYTIPTNRGIISSLVGGVRGINWSGLLSNAQKTLGIVNQAIPMVKQVSPIIGNAKTMFKIMNEFKKVDNVNVSTKPVDNKKTTDISKENEATNVENNIQDTNQPTFFI